jgi:hypothetical protein
VKSPNEISNIFPKHLFWDMNYYDLDLELDQDVIIPRALYMTNKSSFTNDIEKLEKIYTPAQIITNLKTTKELISNEVCELVALRYSIPLFQRFYERK